MHGSDGCQATAACAIFAGVEPDIDLSIVILNWNVAGLLADCLRSLPQAAGRWWPRTEVIVVDNASTDNSVGMVRRQFPHVRLIALPANVGFSEGNNMGIRASRGRYIFLLNPDTVAHPGSIEALVECMQAHPEAGIAGPRLLNPDGTLQPSRRRFPTLATALVESTPLQQWFPGARILRRYYMLDVPDRGVHRVGWLSGAALMCRREALWQAGLLDPGYFMFSEELDLCRRVSDAGWAILYVPHALITHYGGQSTGQNVPARHIHFNTSKARYFRLHEGRHTGRIVRMYLLGVCAGQAVSEAAKWLVGHKRPLRAERLNMYAQVLRSGLREVRPRGLRGRSWRPSVMFITGEFPPAHGGVGDYTCRLSLALQSVGVSVRVLTQPVAHVPTSIPIHVSTSAPDPAVHRPAQEGLTPALTAAITVRTVLRALRGTGAHIAHIQYQTGAYQMRPMVNVLPLLLRRMWRGKIVVTFHDLRVPYLFPRAGPVREWANRLLARTAHAVVATNPEDAACLREWGVRRVEIIPIGSNIPCNPPPGFGRERWRAEHGIGPGTTLLAYFGFLNSSKGLDDLLRALAILKEDSERHFRLLMVGGGLGSSDPTNRRTAAQLDRLAAELGVQDRLLWTGYLPPQQVSAALLSADMAVLPFADGASLRRGSLLAVLEHGLPLITTRQPRAAGHRWSAGSVPELVHGRNAMLVPVGDAQALALAVKQLASDDALRARLADGACQLARHFDWHRIAAMHLSLYGRLCLAEADAPQLLTSGDERAALIHDDQE